MGIAPGQPMINFAPVTNSLTHSQALSRQTAVRWCFVKPARLTAAPEPRQVGVYPNRCVTRRAQTLTWIREMIATERDPDAGVQTVLYPYAGFDAGMVRLFPRARHFITLDKHCFFPSLRAADQPIPSHTVMTTGSFQFEVEVDRAIEEHSVYPMHAIVSALHMAMPDVRLHGIHLFSTAQQGEPLEVDVHGIVVYDQGPGTPLQSFVHIQTRLSNVTGMASAWWFPLVDAVSPDAIIIKGAMGHVAPRPGRVRPIRQQLLHWLERSRGLLVEGRGEHGTHGWELSGYETLERTTSLLSAEVFPGRKFYFGYGYDHHDPQVKVTLFQG